MNILIANVGNIRRGEVWALARALDKNHRVTVAVMSQDSSYRAQAFQFANAPTRVDNHLIGDIPVYEFFSNPADAVSIMLGEIMIAKPPDLVICGIGNGTNLAQDIYVSSHVGMAMEAAFLGYKAVVVATEKKSGGHTDAELEPVIRFIEKNVEAFAKLKLPRQTFLNINVPQVNRYEELSGIRYTSMGKTTLRSTFDKRTDPKGETYYYLRHEPQENVKHGENDDKTWYDRGYVSITPINYDATAEGS